MSVRQLRHFISLDLRRFFSGECLIRAKSPLHGETTTVIYRRWNTAASKFQPTGISGRRLRMSGWAAGGRHSAEMNNLEGDQSTWSRELPDCGDIFLHQRSACGAALIVSVPVHHIIYYVQQYFYSREGTITLIIGSVRCCFAVPGYVMSLTWWPWTYMGNMLQSV